MNEQEEKIRKMEQAIEAADGLVAAVEASYGYLEKNGYPTSSLVKDWIERYKNWRKEIKNGDEEPKRNN